MPSVRYQNVTKIFDKTVTAVDDLVLEINDGEFMVLVGPSGCGKTTALRMLAGLDEPTAGDIFIGDRKVNDVEPKDRNIAMVFQNYALYPHMTVYENIAFGLKLRELKSIFWQLGNWSKSKEIRADIDRRVKETAAMLGIEGLLHRLPKQLSGGQRQRVALGRAIVRKPDVFLMDEPLSNLDAKLRIQTRAELIRLHRQLATTTVYVTHDQVEAMTMGQRITVMNEGVVQQCDTPERIYNEPANKFVAGFIGSPPMNFIDGKIKGGQVVAEDLEFALPSGHPAAAEDGKSVCAGIRPESIELGPGENQFEAHLDVLETLGPEFIAYLNVGNTKLIANIPAENRLAEKEDHTFHIDPAHVHVFDFESEGAIR